MRTLYLLLLALACWLLAEFPCYGQVPTCKQGGPDKDQYRDLYCNFGVELDRLPCGKCDTVTYFHRGQVVSKAAAYAAIEKGTLTDDRAKLRFTVIGGDQDRARALAELPDDLKGACHLWSVPADHWSVKDMGFVTSGSPTVYLQMPGGKVLWRQDAGPLNVTAIRKRKEEYDSKKDPGPNAPDADPLKLARDVYAYLGPGWLAAIGAGAWMLLRSPSQKDTPK